VTVPLLMNFAHQVESTNFITELQTPVVPPSLVEPVAEPLNTTKSASQTLSDYSLDLRQYKNYKILHMNMELLFFKTMEVKFFRY